MDIYFYNALTKKKDKFEPLNPDEIRIYSCRPTVYKDATVAIIIALDVGGTLRVAEFFNEDDAEISYNEGERVAVTWVDGWEVVLPHEMA